MNSEESIVPNEERVAELRLLLDEYACAGSDKAIEKQRRKGKLTIPARLDTLFDANTTRFEVGVFAARGLYEEHGDIRSAGVRTVVGEVSGRDCIVIANDSMVKSGTWFPLTIKKILRAQEIAIENVLPVVYLVDSGGLFLPLQSESFTDGDGTDRIFYHNARLSALGVPQVAAVMGPCVAGGAYVPALCDDLIMVRGTSGIYLGGPYLVEAAIGETVDSETLGGSSTHSRLSGMADYEDDDDAACLARVRRLATQWPKVSTQRLRLPAREPSRDPHRILGHLPDDRRALRGA
jgi:3-methylcrotonyl-CoA carboxylase beta subunit